MSNLAFSSSLSQLLESEEIGEELGKSELKNKQTSLLLSLLHKHMKHTHVCAHTLHVLTIIHPSNLKLRILSLGTFLTPR